MSSIYVNKDLSLKKVRLSKKYHKFMRKMGMRNVYVVPIRKNGLTGSGVLGKCHGNVAKLVTVYGGKVVNGFTIEKDFDSDIGGKLLTFSNHSVWQTPEGKLVDVTYNKVSTGQDTFWFSPVVVYDPSEHFCIFPFDYLLPKHFRKIGLTIASDIMWGKDDYGNWNSRQIPYDLKFLNKESQLITSDRPYLHMVGVDKDDCSFTNPSSATGESWTKIWQRYISENDLVGLKKDPSSVTDNLTKYVHTVAKSSDTFELTS